MEIERKYLLREIPANLGDYSCHQIEQAYLSTNPVLRIRRLDEDYILTYKSSGLLARQEVELPLTKESYDHLLSKADGTIITKSRYVIPLDQTLKIELDVFHGSLDGFIMAEVEFPSMEEANSFTAPDWFGKDVTLDSSFHNSTLSSMDENQRNDFLEKLKEYGC